jgi:acetoin utilization deacetylase AcuC-like enzyme
MNNQTVIFADEIAKEHDTGVGHPEQPARWDAAVRGAGGPDKLHPTHRAATELELALCHNRDYIHTAHADITAGRTSLTTGDTDISRRSWDAALHAAGAVLDSVDLVMNGRARNAFCIVRPPGHHATPSRGMGFCIFNNIAIAARYAQDKFGVNRVLIADWDVHHGNGTQDIFYRDPTVFFFSTHEWPLYPGTGPADETGEGAGLGTTLNCPFPAGSGRDEILGAFEDELVPLMEEFRPGLVLISAGFDSRINDPLGHFTLTDHDFADLTKVMTGLADKYSSGRMISVLEGGYNLAGLESAVHSHTLALANSLP